MATTSLTVRVDESTKKDFDKFCEDIGTNATAAVNMFIKTVVHTKVLPFPITDGYVGEQDTMQSTQLLDIIKRKNIPNVTLAEDENGHAYIDKNKYPDIYDWAVNG